MGSLGHQLPQKGRCDSSVAQYRAHYWLLFLRSDENPSKHCCSALHLRTLRLAPSLPQHLNGDFLQAASTGREALLFREWKAAKAVVLLAEAWDRMIGPSHGSALAQA